MYKAILLPRAEKQLRKVKDRRLVSKFRECLTEICVDPFRRSKVGDLRGVWAHGFSYQGVSYRIAYFIDRQKQTVYVIGLGSHEGFWEEIKRYLK
jgi:mRNA-degrading endonuclease RelE of RelBE toxin-antitoxin system